ncbi:MAG: carboxypeptidase-like regulatory domain-containing protein, partial [Bacteroidales bacterium]|nr:carboxypeptidase-like regulatory domain-containing protein [Bacteroidales bacterium]
MKRFITYLSIAFICFSCTEPVVNTFGSIGGTVQDAKTGEYLAGVGVTVNPLGYSQVTNADGAFQYDNLEVSEYTLVYVKAGYETYKHKVTVKPGVVSSVQVNLVPAEASISVTPSVLDFGSKDSERQMKISSNAGATVSYRLSVSNDWISLSKTSGTITSDDYVTVVVSRGGLSPATYDGNVYITVNDKVTSVPVKMIVEASGVPVVSMEPVSEVTSNSAVVAGTIKSLGDSKVSQYGFCWSSTNPSPGLSDEYNQMGDASDVKSFSAKITGLTPATKYYVRTYAVNTYGTAYSNQVETFTTASAGNGGGGEPDAIAVPQGLMSYYTFNDEDASDITENELDGSLMNSPSFISETVDGTGKALYLNGVKEQYVSIPYNVLKALSKYSVSLWIKDFSQGIVFSSEGGEDIPYLYVRDNQRFMLYNNYYGYYDNYTFAY